MALEYTKVVPCPPMPPQPSLPGEMGDWEGEAGSASTSVSTSASPSLVEDAAGRRPLKSKHEKSTRQQLVISNSSSLDSVDPAFGSSSEQSSAPCFSLGNSDGAGVRVPRKSGASSTSIGSGGISREGMNVKRLSV